MTSDDSQKKKILLANNMAYELFRWYLIRFVRRFNEFREYLSTGMVQLTMEETLLARVFGCIVVGFLVYLLEWSSMRN